jgi:hypothetical protein
LLLLLLLLTMMMIDVEREKNRRREREFDIQISRCCAAINFRFMRTFAVRDLGLDVNRVSID